MVDQVKGFRELQRRLKALGPAVGGKALRSAAMTATLPVLKAARANAPVNDRDYLKKTHKGRRVAPGFLKRNIARKSIISRDKRFVRVMIGPKPEAFYGTAFVELGTSNPERPANPWLEPALKDNRQAVVKRMGVMLLKRINKAAKK